MGILMKNGISYSSGGSELPEYTSADEGKVLKVDEGTPKWLEDNDSEYLLVTITKNGNTYTADKAYNEIRPFAEKGKAIVLYNNFIHPLYQITATSIIFKLIRPYYVPNDFTLKYDSVQSKNIIYTATFTSDNLTYEQLDSYDVLTLMIKNNATLTSSNKELLFRALSSGLNSVNVFTRVSNLDNYYHLYEFNPNNNIAILYDVTKTKRADINFTTGLVTITEIPTLPTPTSADVGKVLMVDNNGNYVLATVPAWS